MAVYATRADLLAALSYDSQAKLSTDPSRRHVVGTGDAVETTFDTPFVEITTYKVYVDGTLLTTSIPTLLRGTGTDGRDQIVFGSAPSAGKIVAVSADSAAINCDVLDAVLASVSSVIDGYLGAALLPITNADLLATLKGKAVLLAQMRLRSRRSLDVIDPLELEWKAAVKWLESVGKGEIPIVSSTVEADPDGSTGDFAYGSFEQVFSDPDEGISA
jgi:phage gp36-like protein